MLEDRDVDADAGALHLLMEDAVRDREPRDGVLDEVAGRIAREPGAGGRPPSGGTLQERVDRYPSWHYAFDLGGGVRTTPRIPGNATATSSAARTSSRPRSSGSADRSRGAPCSTWAATPASGACRRSRPDAST